MLSGQPSLRDSIYGVALAVVALLGGYGLIADELIPLWVAVITAFGSLVVAFTNRPGKGN